MELLAEKEAQDGQKEQPKLGVCLLGEGLVKTAPSKEVSPYLKTGKEMKGVPNPAMEMAMQIRDPVIRANMARTLCVIRMSATGPRDSDSSTEDEEEDRASEQGERVKEKERVKKKGKTGKGITRSEPRRREWNQRRRLNGRRRRGVLKKQEGMKRGSQRLTSR
jgi:hypothetical protein